MQKFFAILVAFALVATGAFADSHIGASVTVWTNLLSDFSGGDDDPAVGQGWDFSVSGTASNDDNTVGVKGEIGASRAGNGGNGWAYAWWRPISELYFKVGAVGKDGNWTGSDICGWGFHSTGGDQVKPSIYRANYSEWWKGWFGYPNQLDSSTGFFATRWADEGPALQMSLYPIDGLTINLGFPIGGSNDSWGWQLMEAKGYIDNIHIQVVYNIAGIGQAALGFINAPDGGARTDWYGDPMALYAQWNMGIGSDMKIEAGLNFNINDQDYKEPLNIGVGFAYGSIWNNDPILFNARVGARIPLEDHDKTIIGGEVMFSYDLGIFRVFAPVGIGVIKPDTGDSIIDFSFSPYIRKQLGGPELFAGFNLFSEGGVSDGNICWAVPVILTWGF